MNSIRSLRSPVFMRQGQVVSNCSDTTGNSPVMHGWSPAGRQGAGDFVRDLPPPAGRLIIPALAVYSLHATCLPGSRARYDSRGTGACAYARGRCLGVGRLW